MSPQGIDRPAAKARLARLEQLDKVCQRFEAAWRSGPAPRIEDYFARGESVDPPLSPRELLVELVAIDMEYRWPSYGQECPATTPASGSEAFESPPQPGFPPRPWLEDYVRRFPELGLLEDLPEELIAGEYRARCLAGGRPGHEEYFQRFPEAAGLGEALAAVDWELASETHPGSHSLDGGGVWTADESSPSLQDQPERIGRYRILHVLGRGGFGTVYLGEDEQLQRRVAVKVPRLQWVASQSDIQTYLAEARALAQLDHPAIVPVYDAGRADDGTCYVVSKYIEGTDLARLIRAGRPSFVVAARIIAAVAEALHHTHRNGLVHRDVKPANILLDAAGRPYLTDFGLAMKEQDFGKSARLAGTPAYTSPEQARGEGHRVDGRCDIFSLGTVFYELLTGRRAFRSRSPEELLEEVCTAEPQPPRQIDDAIPRELERICLKAMSKRVADRYTTALDLAEELRRYLDEVAAGGATQLPSGIVPTAAAASGGGETPLAAQAPPLSDGATNRPSTDTLVKIVPKGLRSFDAEDADFFLELLPGPRDRHGLPDSIRFWKTRIEESEPEKTFPVGLIYGPSGCGKSSLVRAGLLPRLAPHVTTLYLDATHGETEPRLFRGLRRRFPEIPAEADLRKSLAFLRRGNGLEAGQKLLIVLDQFEQWLHTSRRGASDELVQALRQCDGGRVQGLLMVRDEFWMAVTRFMADLEVDLIQGHNAAAVDLFGVRHARKVLAGFGRAFGALPDRASQRTKEQDAFLDQAIDGLADDGKVVCVRLALFAEMMRNKPWTPGTLRAVGGTEGIGATFLEESFCSASANPRHRLHQRAARAVLQALLPEQGTDIKGGARCCEHLRRVAGYAQRPREFESLLQILDGELRLITPTALLPGGGEEDEPNEPQARHYQLSHDYLVPSIREWITRKARQSRRGRAQLFLQEQAALWNARPQRQLLPSFLEWLSILWFTRRADRSLPQRRLLRATTAYYLRLLAVVVAIVLLLAGGAVYWQRLIRRDRVSQQVEALLVSLPDALPARVEELAPFRALAAARLQERLGESLRARERIHAICALAAHGEVESGPLLDSIAEAPRDECRNLVEAVRRVFKTDLSPLRHRTRQTEDPRTRVRYALTLLYLGDPREAAAMSQIGPDPKYRTALIHHMPSWLGDTQAIRATLETTTDGPLRSALCAGLGLTSLEELSDAERLDLVRILRRLYQESPDAGTHSAAGWALRSWKQDLPELPQFAQPGDSREWFVNRVGLTMLRLPAGTYFEGDDEVPLKVKFPALKSGDYRRHRVTLTSPFYISDSEIPLGLFQQFIEELHGDPEAKEIQFQLDDNVKLRSPTGEHPTIGATWHDVLRFCNWLSRKEGRRPCYSPTDQKELLPANPLLGLPERQYAAWACDFTADGYRLPTEAEWEYACRAGSETTFCFGDDESLVRHYALYGRQGPRPVRERVPNAWGLFDMHGNVFEWCWDRLAPHPADPEVDPRGPADLTKVTRVLRGGTYWLTSEVCMSAYRHPSDQLDCRDLVSGFRVVLRGNSP